MNLAGSVGTSLTATSTSRANVGRSCCSSPFSFSMMNVHFRGASSHRPTLKSLTFGASRLTVRTSTNCVTTDFHVE